MTLAKKGRKLPTAASIIMRKQKMNDQIKVLRQVVAIMTSFRSLGQAWPPVRTPHLSVRAALSSSRSSEILLANLRLVPSFLQHTQLGSHARLKPSPSHERFALSGGNGGSSEHPCAMPSTNLQLSLPALVQLTARKKANMKTLHAFRLGHVARGDNEQVQPCFFGQCQKRGQMHEVSCTRLSTAKRHEEFVGEHRKMSHQAPYNELGGIPWMVLVAVEKLSFLLFQHGGEAHHVERTSGFVKHGNMFKREEGGSVQGAELKAPNEMSDE